MTASIDRPTFARRHQLVLFFALAYAFSWWAWIWYRLDPVAADAPILSVGPLLAALVMLALVGGRPALRAWVAKIVHWRVAPRWYLFALLVPAFLTFGAVAINLALGASFTPIQSAPSIVGVAVQVVAVLLMVGLGEEPAWRGYALPRLMVGRTALTAALILAVLHAVWHLPLFGVEYDLANGVPWAVSVFGFSIVTAWMWLHTGGSVLLPIVMHTWFTAVNPIVWRWFDGPDRLHMWWITAGLWAVLTVVIVAADGARLTRRHRQTPDSSPTTTTGDPVVEIR